MYPSQSLDWSKLAAVRLEVRRSAIHGRGIFAIGTLPKGSRLLVRTRHTPGVCEDSELSDDDFQTALCLQHRPCTCRLVCELGRYLNHSFAPTGHFVWVRTTLYYEHDIETATDPYGGIELTTHYGDQHRLVRRLLREQLERNAAQDPPEAPPQARSEAPPEEPRTQEA